MRIAKCLLSIAWAGLLIFFLNTKVGLLPPLGKILSPATGFWQNAEPRKMDSLQKMDLKDIKSDIVVKYDRNRVPHIFAGDEHDLYFAQGYITAKDRLWQMEMQVRKASGKLSEIYGSRTLESDIFYRRIGLLYAAEIAFDSLVSDPVTKKMLEAYGEGINAYISALTPAAYPVEYKIFDREPMKWTPVNSLVILKLMAEQLTGGQSEFNTDNGMRRLGAEAMRDLTGQSYSLYPVVPANTPWDFKPVPIPSPPADRSEGTKVPLARQRKDDGSVIGSNSWVVDGGKARSGYPILANDPHMGLSLPSVWYQVQMNAPGLNVYGVSIPGIPCVIIGYNTRIAWGLTNTKADVMDWYHIKFKDASRQEYWYDGRWNKVQRRVEKIYCAGGRVVSDTIVYTHQGPVMYDGLLHRNRAYGSVLGEDEGFAMNWVSQYVSNDLKAFYLLNRAGNYEDYRNALAYLFCPAQNVLFASIDKDIAVACNGRFPLRYRSQGGTILDGSLPADDWHGWIPMNQIPFTRNPAGKYICSANQALTDSSYPYFIGGPFASDQRAKRINSRLSSMSNINTDSFRLLQTDCYSELAAEVLPYMLRHVKGSGVKVDARIWSQLADWNYCYSANSTGATIFDTWWNELYTMIWRDDLEKYKPPVSWPDFDRTVRVIKTDTASHWIDDINTPQKETLDDIMGRSYLNAIDHLVRKNGNFSSHWAWGNSRPVNIAHVSGLPSFGIAGFAAGGAPNTINALADRFGPSWRMVIEMGPHIRGYGILPGGQSGNPGSFFYDNSFAAWEAGKLNVLVFLNSKDEYNDQLVSSVIFKK